MVGASIYHLYYIFFTSRGKQLIRDLFPRKQDLIDFKDSMFYLLGKSDVKPKLGRFSYIEKMEYWAVVWGTVIMGATGSILWFENFFLKYVGTTGMDISTAIHYYEAILASLAILVWHYYFIFLNPDVYPMNKAWFKGYMTREQMEHEHPLELEEIESASKNDDKNVISESDDNKVNITDEKKSETDELPEKKNSNKSLSMDIQDINDNGKEKKVNKEKNK